MGWYTDKLAQARAALNGPAGVNAAIEDTSNVPFQYASTDRATYGQMDFDKLAKASADVMLEEHNQRTLDAGKIPEDDPYNRWWKEYYKLSRDQFTYDFADITYGRPAGTNTCGGRCVSSDGIPTYNPDQIADREFSKQLASEAEREQRVLEELVAKYGFSRTPIEASRTLPLDPATSRIVQAQIDQVIPPEPVKTDLSTLPPAVEVTSGPAPQQQLGEIDKAILKDPSLPPVPSNILTPAEMAAREARIAGRIVESAPEYQTSAEVEQAAKLRDFFYWKANYPAVRLRPEQNPGLRPDELTTPWPGPGLAPLVNVEITPQQRKLPEKGFLEENISWLGPLTLAIPFVGPVVSAGLSYAANVELKKWAQAWTPNASAFAPQFYPQPFQVPMPLDRAQIMVAQPWYAPAMVDQFAAEVRANQLRAASDAYAQLLAAQGRASNTLNLQATNSATGGALPLLLAGALLVAGAPVAVPLAVVVLLGGKRK